MLWSVIRQHMLQHQTHFIADETARMTFAEAVCMVEQIAAALPKGRYAIRCRSEMYAGLAILACLAGGVTAVPLSNRYGDVHCDRILRLTEPDFLLTDEDGSLRVCPMRTVVPNGGAADACRHTDAEEHCALILCTSGTTGVPKGAMITEENLLANLRDIDAYFDLRCSDLILIARPIYHCAVLTGEFLIGLWRGANIRFRNAAFDPMGLAADLAEGITVFAGTPTLLTLLSRVASRASASYELRLLISSGECMTPRAAAQIRAAFPKVRIMNVYGLTEASPRVAYLPPELFDRYPDSVGYPLRSLEAQIVDLTGKPVPTDTVGELIVRGPSVMKGYFRAPEATRRALAGGWLHTGDMACMDADGRIRVKCRRDNMLILAGINIYPQEIENVLRADPRVSDVLAYASQTDGARPHIALQIVCDMTSEEVLRLCRTCLPAYEQPTEIHIVQALPRNASGKLIRPGKGAEL